MLAQMLSTFYERDLVALKKEIESYPDESLIWKVDKSISNSAGNLCLHLTGNLKHFIGATLGNTGYVRNRDAEFVLKDVPQHVLITNIEEASGIVKSVLQKLSDADMEKDFPLQKHGETVSTAHMLLHLSIHLAYHLGQVNYHRRLLAS